VTHKDPKIGQATSSWMLTPRHGVVSIHDDGSALASRCGLSSATLVQRFGTVLTQRTLLHAWTNGRQLLTRGLRSGCSKRGMCGQTSSA
jgi:hypothetical protein